VIKQQQLCRQQTNIEIELLGRRPIGKEDLIPSVKNLSSLATLYHSVVCLFEVSLPHRLHKSMLRHGSRSS